MALAKVFALGVMDLVLRDHFQIAPKRLRRLQYFVAEMLGEDGVERFQQEIVGIVQPAERPGKDFPDDEKQRLTTTLDE